MPVMTQLETETRGSRVQGPLKFEANLGYMELFFKKKSQKSKSKANEDSASLSRTGWPQTQPRYLSFLTQTQ